MLKSFREPHGEKRLSMVFTGDFSPVGESVRHIIDGESRAIAADVLPFLASADLRVMQFETVLTDAPSPIPKCGPNLIAPPDCVKFPVELGIDVALLANNHTGDHGPDAAMATQSTLEANGIATVGLGADPLSAARPLVMERAGFRIAFLNVAENEFGMVRRGHPGSNPLSPFANIRAIREAKKSADLVILCIHGGHEYYPFPSPRMVDTYRAFADAGADLVFGCHTHCVIGMERHENVPIVYSPGNFFFPYTNEFKLPPCWFGGFLPKFYFDEAGVYAVDILPYSFDTKAIHTLSKERKELFFRDFDTLSSVISEPDAIGHLFEVWSAHTTKSILDWMAEGWRPVWPLPDLTDASVKPWLLPRNLFTCETHHDATATFLRLIEERRLDALLPLFQTEIAPLQTPGWLKE